MSELTDIIHRNGCKIAELERELANTITTLRETVEAYENIDKELDATNAREEAYRADVVRLTATIDALRQNANDADRELAASMRRVKVLKAEVQKWRAWNKRVVHYHTTKMPPMEPIINALHKAIAATDAAGALA